MTTNLKYFSLLFIFSVEVKYEDLKSPIDSREHAPCDGRNPRYDIISKTPSGSALLQRHGVATPG